MSFEIPGVLWRRDPETAEVPLVFDSPHSGSEYPEDFRFCCSLDVLRTAEDAYVDELYAAAPQLGATLIGAIFPRSYLDPNRAADDLDATHIDGTWPTPLLPLFPTWVVHFSPTKHTPSTSTFRKNGSRRLGPG